MVALATTTALLVLAASAYLVLKSAGASPLSVNSIAERVAAETPKQSGKSSYAYEADLTKLQDAARVKTQNLEEESDSQNNAPGEKSSSNEARRRRNNPKCKVNLAESAKRRGDYATTSTKKPKVRVGRNNNNFESLRSCCAVGMKRAVVTRELFPPPTLYEYVLLLGDPRLIPHPSERASCRT